MNDGQDGYAITIARPLVVLLVVLLAVPGARAQQAEQPPANPAPMAATRVPGDTLRLTLAGARTLARQSNPDLQAFRLDIAIARGELRQAGVLLPSNPSADVLVGGPGAEVGLTQEIEIAGQRGARRAAGRAGLERAEARVLNAARLTIADVDRGYYRLVASRQRELLATEVLTLNQRLADVATRQLAAGDISQLEANLATVEYGRSRSKALAAQRERQEAESEILHLLGLPPRTPIAPVMDLRADLITSGGSSDSLPAASLTALALSRRPDLVERAAATRQALALASVARREAFPNLQLRASSEQLEGGEGRVLRPGIGITLPAFNRNQGEVEARRAEARQAELERAALVAGIRADVGRAAAAYSTAAAEVRVLDETVLAPARENRRLLEIAYRAGKVGLPVLLLIRNQVIDAELEYWDAWLAAHEALADLAATTGANARSDSPSQVPIHE